MADRERGPAALLQVLEVCARVLAAVVRTVPAEARAFHVFGRSDPEGFAAMGVVEIIVHADDVARGLGVAWRPPEDLCDRVLARLFRDVPAGGDRWATLLWATGRGALPGREPVGPDWRWYSAPPEERSDG